MKVVITLFYIHSLVSIKSFSLCHHLQTIGCDMKLGSQKRLDMCGQCGGDNSTCTNMETVKQVFDETNLSPGLSSCDDFESLVCYPSV